MPETFVKYYKLHKGVDINTLNSNFSNNSSQRTFFYFITTLNFSTSTNIPWGITQPFTSGVFFPNASLGTIPHELGHILNLDHTFDPPFNWTRYSTLNYMDSRQVNSDTRNGFGYFQWIDVY